jgi:hypothetical protein
MYAYYISFFNFLFRIQDNGYVNGVGSRKKEREKKERKETNGEHKERRWK